MKAENSNLDLFYNEKVRELVDHFAKCFDVRVVLCDARGQILMTDQQSSNCQFCQYIQNDLYGKEPCFKMDQDKQEEASAKKEMIVYECHAGMIEVIVPLFINEVLIGYFFIGQFRDQKSIKKEVRDDWMSKMKNNEIEEAFLKQTLISKDKVQSVMTMFKTMVDYLLSMHHIQFKTHLTIEPVINYIKENPGKPLKLEAAARLAHCSTSTLSHLFPKLTGKTYIQFLNESRIEHSERLMQQHPDMKIAEIARLCYFDDAYYFSRLYKKIRSYSPKEYMKLYNC